MGILERLKGKQRDDLVDRALEHVIHQFDLTGAATREQERADAMRIIREQEQRIAAELPAMDAELERAAVAKQRAVDAAAEATAECDRVRRRRDEFLGIAVRAIDGAKGVLSWTASPKVNELRHSLIRERDALGNGAAAGLSNESVSLRRAALIEAFFESEGLCYLPDGEVDAAFEQLQSRLPKTRPASQLLK